MAGAFVIVALSEWLAARARFVAPAVAFLPALDEREPAPYVEVRPNWGAGELGPSEDTEAEALTIIAGADEHGVDPWEQQPADADLDDPELEDEPAPAEPGLDEPELAEPELAEPELAERGGMFRRRRR
jgi:hypothetical protein